ncbi:MAG: transglutaminase-like domain-containing protein [Planctomycetota bacterium]
MHDCLPSLETPRGLLRAAIAIARHGDPDLDAERVETDVARIVSAIRARMHGTQPRAIVAHAHAVLFDELGFRGDTEDYYDPRNSFVQHVLQRRRGLPILLTLIYKLVLDPLGPLVRGVNTPGHFLAHVEAGAGFTPMLVDPFAGGRVLTAAELIAQVREVTGEHFEVDPQRLPFATHREWVLRILRNLVGIYHARNMAADRAAMEELSRLVRQS